MTGMYFSAEALMWLLKAVLEKAGGEVTITTDSDLADRLLMFEGSDDGSKVTLKVVRFDEGRAGHA